MSEDAARVVEALRVALVGLGDLARTEPEVARSIAATLAADSRIAVLLSPPNDGAASTSAAPE